MYLRAAISAIALLSCTCRGGEGPRRDPHSHAQPDRIAVRHLTLDLTVDFVTHKLAGTARLSLTRIDRGAALVLDGDGLAIDAVRDCEARPLKYRIDKRDSIGERIVVDLSDSDCVEIAYQTSPDAGALLWVEPSGTAGKQKPMLFTQSQATRARTWIPLQDSPSVRFTYDATIRVPAGMWALMSAENLQAPPADGVWRVRQPRAIPSYLMALAVGDFAFRPIGPRSGVYAEPAVVEAAAHEFVEVEAMIDAAEKLYGPYRWSRYDMLVLPPSFPFGGMENPNLTFLTPTVISGDRALVSLIAHELAHSWSGNLVTNATWNDLWLNEGVTTYVEHRIMEELRGRETGDLLWYTSRKDLDRALTKYGSGNSVTRLAHDFGRELAADDIPSEVAYNKGALFLRTLEQAYGRDKFDGFLRGWFDRHAFQSVTTRMFETEANALLGTQVDLKAWLYQPGVPANAVPSTSSRATVIETIAASGAEPTASTWSTLDWVVYLRALPADIAPARLTALDERYRLTASPNNEIAMHWLPLVVRADLRDGAAAVEAFLVSVGRRRMVKPLFEAMMAGSEFWRALAKTTFERAKPGYHPITRETIAEIVQ